MQRLVPLRRRVAQGERLRELVPCRCVVPQLEQRRPERVMRLHAVRRVARPRRLPHELFRQLRAVGNAPALRRPPEAPQRRQALGRLAALAPNARARA